MFAGAGLYEAKTGFGSNVAVVGRNAGTSMIPRIESVRMLRLFGNLTISQAIVAKIVVVI